jgi:hypothetical protein
MSEPFFKIEDRGNGYRFVTCPEVPGFSAMLEPGELNVPDEILRILFQMVVIDSTNTERERCAKIAEADPELPRPMPEELRLVPLEDVLRAVCRATKKSIATAIRKQK